MPGAATSANLWALGVSGDLPIVTAMVREQAEQADREVLAAHSYWRTRGFRAGSGNSDEAGYDRPLNFQLQRIIDAHAREVGTDRPGGVFLRDWSLLTDTQRTLVLSSSRAVLVGARGALARQLPAVREPAPPAMPLFRRWARRRRTFAAPFTIPRTQLFQQYWRLFQDGKECAIYLGPGTDASRSNVICHSGFRLHGDRERPGRAPGRATASSTDSPPGKTIRGFDLYREAIYFRDEDSGSVWTPTALPIREDDQPSRSHGQGYTVFEHNSHAIGTA